MELFLERAVAGRQRTWCRHNSSSRSNWITTTSNKNNKNNFNRSTVAVLRPGTTEHNAAGWGTACRPVCSTCCSTRNKLDNFHPVLQLIHFLHANHSLYKGCIKYFYTIEWKYRTKQLKHNRNKMCELKVVLSLSDNFLYWIAGNRIKENQI